MNTIILGKNSNLSQCLQKRLSNSIVISSREVQKDISILEPYKNRPLQLIFNSFQTALSLNNLDNPAQYIEQSIGVTAKVLEYFKDTPIDKIIYTSSSSVYGNNILCKESDDLKPMNLHASLKVANEKIIQKFCLDKNIDFTIARIFNMYGQNDNFSIVSKILKASSNNDELTIVNNGNAIRDFIHIDDVVEVYEKLLRIKDLPIVNVGTGIGTSIKHILDFLKNRDITLTTKSIERVELKVSTADNLLLRNRLNKDEFIKVEDYLVTVV